jgi:amino acid adenylation domain-containing protein
MVTLKAESLLPNPAEALACSWEGAVHSHFAQQAQRVPEKLAVVDAQGRWSYGELDARSNQLANYLRFHGIHNQDLVAIYAHRSASLVWAMLGVLKAGAAFVILDPAYPADRLTNYLRLAQPKAWLQLKAAGEVPAELAGFVESLSCCCRLQLDQHSLATASEALMGYSSQDPQVSVEPDDLLYVAFTSGSTGIPKGILGTHRPLSHFLKWHCQAFGFTESDRFSMLSGLAHDPLLRDIFTPLSLGATLCIPQQQDIETPGHLATWMQQQQVSISHLTPAMGQLLANTTQATTTKGELMCLRYVFFGGDMLTQHDVSRIRQLAPTVTCVNFYGATETPQAMGYFIVANPQNEVHDCQPTCLNERIPLGRGIEDVQLLVLTPTKQLAGIDEVGEIYVRTPYLAKGYIGSDELTYERFIINPFTLSAEDRLYKTGDLGRYLPDGNIECLGRIDDQVKIRGFRIELGEIEAFLAQAPTVREALVIAREDHPGNKRLVAYVVPNQEQVPTTSELRRALKEKLPDYMVPSAFVMLNALPLTPNGKVDRRALPSPDQVRQEPEETFVPPQDELELQVTKIWETVLGVHPIGIRDNFFELGGHSLLAVRLFSEIEKITGKNLPLATLFQATTVEELAGLLRQQGWFAPWSPLVTIQSGGSKPPLFCIHPIGGNILDYRNLVHYLGKEQPVYGLQAQGLDGKQAPLSRVEDMATLYIKEIRTLYPEGPYFLAGYSFGGTLAFEMAQQLHAQGQKVALLALCDTQSPTLQENHPSFVGSVLIHLSNLWQLEPKAKLHYLLDLLRSKLKKVTYREFLRSELSESVENFAVLDANMQADKDYVPQIYSGSVTLFRCRVQEPKFSHDPQLGWGELVAEKLEIHDIPGSHYVMLKEPHVRVLAEKLRLCLNKSQAYERDLID